MPGTDPSLFVAEWLSESPAPANVELRYSPWPGASYMIRPEWIPKEALAGQSLVYDKFGGQYLVPHNYNLTEHNRWAQTSARTRGTTPVPDPTVIPPELELPGEDVAFEENDEPIDLVSTRQPGVRNLDVPPHEDLTKGLGDPYAGDYAMGSVTNRPRGFLPPANSQLNTPLIPYSDTVWADRDTGEEVGYAVVLEAFKTGDFSGIRAIGPDGDPLPNEWVTGKWNEYIAAGGPTRRGAGGGGGGNGNGSAMPWMLAAAGVVLLLMWGN